MFAFLKAMGHHADILNLIKLNKPLNLTEDVVQVTDELGSIFLLLDSFGFIKPLFLKLVRKLVIRQLSH